MLKVKQERMNAFILSWSETNTKSSSAICFLKNLHNQVIIIIVIITNNNNNTIITRQNISSLTLLPHSKVLPSVFPCVTRTFTQKIRKVSGVIITPLQQLSSKVCLPRYCFIIENIFHSRISRLFLVAAYWSDTNITRPALYKDTEQ